MRLLDTESLRLEEFDGHIPPYSILSHVWGEGEVLYHDILGDASAASQKHGYAKVVGAAALARSKGYRWIWIDSCCINKTSSSELSEAINSMFRWYREAEVCYVYLIDVDAYDVMARPTAFFDSRWFTRGWTLQELIAPRKLEFYNSKWRHIGDRWDLRRQIQNITRISLDCLSGHNMNRIRQESVAKRMSWAANRTTKRPEDMAYCLLGLFDINMPLLYGEGGPNAFRRLQQAILAQTGDQSIFAWGEMMDYEPSAFTRWDKLPVNDESMNLFAPHPSSFEWSGGVEPAPDLDHRFGLSIHHDGIGLSAPILTTAKKNYRDAPVVLVPLRCYIKGDLLNVPCIAVTKSWLTASNSLGSIFQDRPHSSRTFVKCYPWLIAVPQRVWTDFPILRCTILTKTLGDLWRQDIYDRFSGSSGHNFPSCIFRTLPLGYRIARVAPRTAVPEGYPNALGYTYEPASDKEERRHILVRLERELPTPSAIHLVIERVYPPDTETESRRPSHVLAWFLGSHQEREWVAWSEYVEKSGRLPETLFTESHPEYEVWVSSAHVYFRYLDVIDFVAISSENESRELPMVGLLEDETEAAEEGPPVKAKL